MEGYCVEELKEIGQDVSERTGLNCLRWKANKLIQRENKTFLDRILAGLP
jgi:hypothetical protein